MKNKRVWIFSIIAVLLLIATLFILENWNTVRPDQSCLKVDIKLFEINGKNQICYSGNVNETWLSFNIMNNKKETINDLDVTIIGETDVYSNRSVLNLPLESGRVSSVNVTYDSGTYGKIEKVVIVPRISVNEEIVYCLDNAIDVENITACT